MKKSLPFLLVAFLAFSVFGSPLDLSHPVTNIMAVQSVPPRATGWLRPQPADDRCCGKRLHISIYELGL
jgi:hypothetical protein